MSKSNLEDYFEYQLNKLASDLPQVQREYRFHKSRRWRFDFAWSHLKVACEIDGGQWAPRGGRHNRDSDRWKMSEAAALGWCVLRFSGTMLRMEPKRCIELVRAAIKEREKSYVYKRNPTRRSFA